MKLVTNWRHLWKAWSLWALSLGALLPELLQVLADHSDLIPYLDDGYKSGIRLGCILLAIVLKPIHQPGMHSDEQRP